MIFSIDTKKKKSVGYKSVILHDINSQQTMNRRELSQTDEGHP